MDYDLDIQFLKKSKEYESFYFLVVVRVAENMLNYMEKGGVSPVKTHVNFIRGAFLPLYIALINLNGVTSNQKLWNKLYNKFQLDVEEVMLSIDLKRNKDRYKEALGKFI